MSRLSINIEFEDPTEDDHILIKQVLGLHPSNTETLERMNDQHLDDLLRKEKQLREQGAEILRLREVVQGQFDEAESHKKIIEALKSGENREPKPEADPTDYVMLDSSDRAAQPYEDKK